MCSRRLANVRFSVNRIYSRVSACDQRFATCKRTRAAVAILTVVEGSILDAKSGPRLRLPFERRAWIFIDGIMNWLSEVCLESSTSFKIANHSVSPAGQATIQSSSPSNPKSSTKRMRTRVVRRGCCTGGCRLCIRDLIFLFYRPRAANYDFFFFGTFLPFFRAFESPIAIACFAFYLAAFSASTAFRGALFIAAHLVLHVAARAF